MAVGKGTPWQNRNDHGQTDAANSALLFHREK